MLTSSVSRGKSVFGKSPRACAAHTVSLNVFVLTNAVVCLLSQNGNDRSNVNDSDEPRLASFRLGDVHGVFTQTTEHGKVSTAAY